MNAAHVKLIHALLAAAEARGCPLWLESGWAVDARLCRITREHEDVDLAVPRERIADFRRLLDSLGATGFETTDYGFLVRVGGVLLDCEPCVRVGRGWELEGMPPGSCPYDKQGVIENVPVRCTSWDAILWEYFHYLQEVPHRDWPAKDKESYRLVRETLGRPAVERCYEAFLAGGRERLPPP